MKHTFKLFSGILGVLILGSCQLSPTISSETSKGVDESIAESNVQTEVPSIPGPIETSEEGPVIDSGGPITVYLWSNTLYPQFAKHIQTKLADIDIQFVVGNNDLDFYRFMNDYGKLPDIITCRRFALRDAAPISSQLMDLSDTSAAGSIYDTYLTNFTNRDGSIQWLPMVGEVDGFVINKKLFRDNNIPIPTDYASFVDACDKFDKLGIRGFVGDYTYDYTCMGILQGLSIPSLTSLKGLRWRSQYEDPNALRPGLDEEIWPKAFETMAKFLADTKAQASDVNMKYSTLANMFVQGKVAMVRAGGSNVVGYSDPNAYPSVEPQFLPYFGQNGGEWLLTYPAFQIALNKKLGENSARKAKALRILNAVMEDEAQAKLVSNSEVISYSKDSKLSLHESLSSIQPLIDKNRLFIRIASNDFFSVSKTVVQKMIKGEVTAQEAYAEFDAALRAEKSAVSDPILKIENGYDYLFDEQWGGNPSASAMANSLRKAYGTDVLIASSWSFTGATFPGEYPENQVGYMIMPNALDAYPITLTGKQLKEHIAWMIGGNEYTIRTFNQGALPTISGLTIKVKQSGNSFSLLGVFKDGVAIQDEDTFTSVTLNPASAMGSVLPREGLTWKTQGTRVRNYWINLVKKAHDEGGNFVFEAPTPNVFIEKE